MWDKSSPSTGPIHIERGSNYYEEMDVASRRAYVRVNTDPVTSSERKVAIFYERICCEYVERRGDACPLPTTKSAETWYKLVFKYRTLFSVCVDIVKSLKKSNVLAGAELSIEPFNSQTVDHPQKNLEQMLRFMRL